ncbi:thioesterase [Rickenella mellea]|uniref:Thioesterase n=1 Tax=Rickenella mellea TaxID=50990 RepID=A0A4Y7PJ93_9AGAM|nr:thioesterase [Rickenella mellea]
MPTSVLKSRTRTDYPYFLTYRTRWSDNDQYGHINNSIYYHLFDSVINSYLIAHCGISPSSPDSSSPIGLVVSSHCEFFQPLSFPQTLVLGLRVNKLGRTSVEYEVGVFSQDADEVAAVGGYTHVFVGKTSRRPVKDGMGEQLRKGLEMLRFEDGTEKKARL